MKLRIPFLGNDKPSPPNIPAFGPVHIDPPPASCQSPPITNEELHQRLGLDEATVRSEAEHRHA
jgi:hypothetical protein